LAVNVRIPSYRGEGV